MTRGGINSIICDNILRKFDGVKAISREKMRQTGFHVNIDAEWSVVEEHINFLVADRALKEEDAMLSLTSRGLFMLSNADKVGYVAQKIDDVQWKRSERDTRIVVRTTVYVALAVTIVWAVIKLVAIFT